MKASTRKTILIIMDGWGLGKPDKFNAIDNARTPNVDRLIREYPNTVLKTDGLSVGLPEGQFGTSEVNHLTIGSGRVILQDLPRINTAIASGDFYHNSALTRIVEHVTEQNSRLHLIGILSDGGVHSHIQHLFAIFELLRRRSFSQPIFLHLFSDGRDVAPKSVKTYLDRLNRKIQEYKDLNISVASIQGRVLLDRDRDWDKTEKAAQVILHGKGIKIVEVAQIFTPAYEQMDTDEYLGQYVLSADGTVQAKDGAFIFHYRTDRIYQIISRIYGEKISNFILGSFVLPGEEFAKLEVAFPRYKIKETLAETLSAHNKSQMHIAETEKYPHVTYFFNGERETELPMESWKSFESNRFVKPMYNFDPDMQNGAVTKAVIATINEEKPDFVLANLSSADMVGHTGNYHAAVVSAESVDYCIGKIYEAVKDRLHEYALLITADHGNSEEMWDYKNDQPHTQHTLSKVPFILVSDIKCRLDPRETLEDIAPTILDLLEVDKPKIMTDTSLILRNN